jgi:hypothetical protein
MSKQEEVVSVVLLQVVTGARESSRDIAAAARLTMPNVSVDLIGTEEVRMDPA